MNVYAPFLGALPFFLGADEGERFCLYHQPRSDVRQRGAILYVHPFAEELNKSRRMAALQARAYAQAGVGVLQMDLYGCGDSSGDFADARWETWLDDLSRAWQWLLQRCAGPYYLWGLRLGCLLALDFAARARPDALVLWQPTLSGRAHLHQFTRMQSAARLFGNAPAAEQEIAGYRVAPQLSEAIARLDAAAMTPRCPVQWLELSGPAQQAADAYAAAAGGGTLQPASALLIDRWRESGARVDAYPVAGPPFWLGAEIDEVPALVSATLAAACLEQQ